MELVAIPTTSTTTTGDGKDLDHNRDGNHDEDSDEKEDDGLPPLPPSSSLCFMHRFSRLLRQFMRGHRRQLKIIALVVLVLAYLGYFSYCMYFRFGDEPSVRLLVGTIVGVYWLVRSVCTRPCPHSLSQLADSNNKRVKIVKTVGQWSLYVTSVGGALAILCLDVVTKRPQNLICVGGIALLILSCFFLSRQPEKINWHAVFWGISLQFWFAVLIGKTTFGSAAFEWLAERTVEFLTYADKGSVVVFGDSYLEHRFVFQIMPTIIFFNATISVLYYLGVVQVIFARFGKFLSVCIGTSPVESVSTASNLFLSLVETPALIRPFAEDITDSELFAVMTGGFASIAGSLLWAFAAYGAPINHILTASVMSAPAALAFAKLLYPDERKPTVKAEDAYKVDIGPYGSLLGALSTGAKDGLKMVGLIVVNLLIYTSALEFLDQTVLWFAERAGVEGMTMSKLLAYLFYPITYLMGFEAHDCFQAARLLGLKILTLTTVSFIELGKIITNGKQLENYVDTYNATWTYVGDDIFLEATNTTLIGGVISERSGILATYMICGLSNLGCIGITVGAYVAVAPTRSSSIFSQVSMACLAGNLACFSTACVAGLLYTD